MASDLYKCEAEISITINVEVKEEVIEYKPIGEYVVFQECLEKNGNHQFDDPNSSEFEVMPRNSDEVFKESKCSPTHFNGLDGELENHKFIHFNNGVLLKNEDEDHPEYIDLLTNNAEVKTEALKTEDDIEIVYEDVKHEICEEKSSEKNESKFYPNSIADILIGTDIGPNFPHELSIDSETWHQQNIEEDGIAEERDNDTRKEPKVTTDSKNCQMIQKLPLSKYSKLYPFESKQELNERSHTGEKPFQCKVCSKNFAHKSILFDHEITHTLLKPYQCTICKKSYKYKRNLSIHERVHTGEKQFQCQFCSKNFAHKNILFDHERIHTGEKPYQCKICEKSFSQKANLMIHERIHTGDKPFQCKICSKSFMEKGALTKHERTHTGEKPFQCKICSKSFAAKDTMLVHERIHSGKKPFQCKICSKNFAHKGTLFDHEKFHTGIKPFQCKICTKSFTLKAHLMRHEKVHTEEIPF